MRVTTREIEIEKRKMARRQALKAVYNLDRDGSYDEAMWAVHLANRALLVAEGSLPHTSKYKHKIALNPKFVSIEVLGMIDHETPSGSYAIEGYQAMLTRPGLRAIERTTTGGYDLWFNDDGYSFLSFQNDGDAEMFVLALEGGAA